MKIENLYIKKDANKEMEKALIFKREAIKKNLVDNMSGNSSKVPEIIDRILDDPESVFTREYRVTNKQDSKQRISIKPNNNKMSGGIIINRSSFVGCTNLECPFRYCCYNTSLENGRLRGVIDSRTRTQIIFNKVHNRVVESIDNQSIDELKELTKDILEEEYFPWLRKALTHRDFNENPTFIRFNECGELLDDIDVIIYNEIANYLTKDLGINAPPFIYTHNKEIHLELFDDMAVNLSGIGFSNKYNTFWSTDSATLKWIKDNLEYVQRLLGKEIVFCPCPDDNSDINSCDECDICKYNTGKLCIEELREKKDNKISKL